MSQVVRPFADIQNEVTDRGKPWILWVWEPVTVQQYQLVPAQVDFLESISE